MFKQTLWIPGILCAAALAATPGDLGRIDFPTSGTPAAQARFLRGVLYLHSFEYEDAAKEFQAASRLEPAFAMAHWGEAMTHNHPIWNERDAEAARKVLDRLAPSPEARLARAPTAREKAYLSAVEVLYGEGEKPERDRAYAEEMRRLHEAFPEDAEAASFYSLALLGTCQADRDIPTYMRAAAVAEEVFAKNREHPGAAHYLIHSYDDPVHAPLGLRAARVYARIAAAAPHALHMPSHIFLALGMWEEVVASNEASWEASRRSSYHALHWLEYAYLQERRLPEARRTLATIETDARESATPRTARALSEMGATYRVETGGCEGVAAGGGEDPRDRFVAGFCAWKRGDRGALSKALAALTAPVSESPGGHHGHGEGAGPRAEASSTSTVTDVFQRQLEALSLLLGGDTVAAIERAREAARVEESLSVDFGPPVVAKPPRELLGEILLGLGRAREAREEFERALARAPGRALSLQGLARSAAKAGEAELARKTWTELAGIWRRADPDLPEVREARQGAGVSSPSRASGKGRRPSRPGRS